MKSNTVFFQRNVTSMLLLEFIFLKKKFHCRSEQIFNKVSKSREWLEQRRANSQLTLTQFRHYLCSCKRSFLFAPFPKRGSNLKERNPRSDSYLLIRLISRSFFLILAIDRKRLVRRVKLVLCFFRFVSSHANNIPDNRWTNLWRIRRRKTIILIRTRRGCETLFVIKRKKYIIKRRNLRKWDKKFDV